MQDFKNGGQDASFALATIKIKDLRLRTYIGFNPEEKTRKQDVVVNIGITYVTNQAVLEDQIEGALNYKTITKGVIQLVEGGLFLLLEKLVADVLVVCSRHPGVTHASVTIDKPHALRFAESVSLTLERHANTCQSMRFLEKAS